MKKQVVMYSLLFAGLGNAITANAASLKGTIGNLTSSQKIYLLVYQGDMLIKTDSVKHKSGKFIFKSKEKSYPRGVYKVGLDPENSTPLILSDEDVQMECNGRNWEDARFSNSKENSLLLDYQNYSRTFTLAMGNLDRIYQSNMPLSQSNKPAFEKIYTELRSKADSLMKQQQLKYKEWLSGDPKLYFTKMMRLLSPEPATSPETYITAADFNDPENLRSDVWTTRVSNMMQKFGQQDPGKWTILADQVIALTTSGTIAREVALRAVATALKPLEQSGLSNAYDIAKRYTQEFPGAESATFIKDFTPGPPGVGEIAPDIVMKDREGNIRKLSDLRGKIVLLDFWASWCGPCRHENPNVVKAYMKYEPKGFTVFSVSLDNNRDKWLAAITKDNLIWQNHVSDLKGWQSEGSALYRVTGIPATFLIDKNGTIVAKNLRGQALEDKLAELIGE